SRRDGAPAGEARSRLGGHHGDAGLHRARPLSVPRRRDRAPRRGALRADLALRAAAGARARIRDGLPLRRPGKRRLKSFALAQRGQSIDSSTVRTRDECLLATAELLSRAVTVT